MRLDSAFLCVWLSKFPIISGMNICYLCLRSLFQHSGAAFFASLSSSGFGSADNIHTVALFNFLVSLPNAIL